MDVFLEPHVLERIRAEYLEMPGMRLTIGQVQRLCGVGEAVCLLAMDTLVQSNFLCLNSNGTYSRLTEGRPSIQRQAKAALKTIPQSASRRAS